MFLRNPTLQWEQLIRVTFEVERRRVLLFCLNSWVFCWQKFNTLQELPVDELFSYQIFTKWKECHFFRIFPRPHTKALVGGMWRNVDLFLTIACLNRCWPPGAVATYALLTHAPPASSRQYMLSPIPLPSALLVPAKHQGCRKCSRTDPNKGDARAVTAVKDNQTE